MRRGEFSLPSFFFPQDFWTRMEGGREGKQGGRGKGIGTEGGKGDERRRGPKNTKTIQKKEANRKLIETRRHYSSLSLVVVVGLSTCVCCMWMPCPGWESFAPHFFFLVLSVARLQVAGQTRNHHAATTHRHLPPTQSRADYFLVMTAAQHFWRGYWLAGRLHDIITGEHAEFW